MSKATIDKELDFQETIVRSASNTSSQVDFIRSKQQEALKRLQNLRFPTTNDEDWKYYNFKNILDVEFNIEKSSLKPIEHNFKKDELNHIVEKYVFAETAANLLVTINGAYSKELSNFNFDDEEIKILDFNNPEEIAKNPEAVALINKYYANDLDKEQKYFKLVNTLLMKNGFFLQVKDNVTASKTLQILHISNQNSSNHMRSLIYLGKNSKIDLMVSYVGLQDSKYFTNAVIECFLDDNAKLRLEKIQNESKEATSLYTFSAKLSKNSDLEFNSFAFGSKSSREDIDVDIDGTNSNASVNGLYVVNNSRESHHKVSIIHNSPHCTSEQLFKGLLQGKSRAEFNGLIDVTRDAQKTDAKQLNNNLLLSKDAHIDSRPQLNILADDVKCSHGSTIGKLNPEEIFYLKSRGLCEVNAKTVLTYSFCKELIDKISLVSARNYASNLAFASLREGEQDPDEINTLALLAENSKFKKSKLNA